MRRSFATTLCCAALLLGLLGTVPDARSREEKPAAPPAEILATLEVAAEIEWYYVNDLGLLLVYGDQKLHRIDLMAGGGTLAPVPLPGLSKKGSVAPVPGTGLLLVAEAPAGAGPGGAAAAGRPTSSYGVDTLAGKILWEAPPLPSPNVVFAYPDEGFVAYRSSDEERMLAVDLGSGKRLWEHATPVNVVWTEGAHVRLLTGGSLWTVVARTGEVVRRDAMPEPGKARAFALPKEGVFIVWKKRDLEAYSLPPPPPAEAVPAKPLWSFEAAGLVLEGCIKIGACDVERVGPDRLQVESGGHLELVKITTGERLWDIKRGAFSAHDRLSPDLRFVARPKGDELIVVDGATGKEIHEIPYPKGDEGSNLAKYARWLTNDIVITVFPTKEGAPRRMSGFSASQGRLLWTVVFPDAPDYKLTSEQRGKLFGRILLSLALTAASAANPMSVGGTNYAVVVVPGLDVSSSLSADGATARGAGEQGSRPGSPYSEAAARVAAVRSRMSAEGPGRAHYVVGEGERFEILEIDRGTGGLRAVARYEAPKVHAILPFTEFERGLAIENDNRRLRILSLAPRPATGS